MRAACIFQSTLTRKQHGHLSVLIIFRCHFHLQIVNHKLITPIQNFNIILFFFQYIDISIIAEQWLDNKRAYILLAAEYDASIEFELT